jgi:hypothetical protein
VNTDEFLTLVLLKYHPFNQLIENLPANFDKVEFAPWLTRSGNKTENVLEVYLQSNQPFNTEKFMANDQAERLKDLINLCKKMPDHEKQSFTDNPNKLVLFRIRGVHAAGVFFGHPSLAKAWQEESATEDWIEKSVLLPGRAVSEGLLDSQTRFHFLREFRQTILPSFLREERWDIFMDFVEKIPQSISIQEYRRAILEICQEIDPACIPLLDKIARQVDCAICQSLEPSLKKELEHSAVHFGDTNLSQGTQDIHFCFVVNPGTGDLELWEVNDDGSHFVALDQKYWLQEWEIYLLSEKIIPSDPLTSNKSCL